MDDELERYEIEVAKSVEVQRKRVVEKITFESSQLVDELLKIIYSEALDERGNPIVDAKVKLAAISMLLDRGIPKLAVDGTKQAVVEESSTRRKLRQEIEDLVKGDKKDPE